MGNDHPFKVGLDVLKVNGLLTKKDIWLLFEPVKLSVKEFEQLLEPAVAPAENCFQKFGEDQVLDEFRSFLRRFESINFCFIQYVFDINLFLLKKNLDGDIKGEDSDGKELTVASVYRFITSSKIFPWVRHD